MIDFKELSFVKQFLDTNIDHRFIISLEDPGFERLVGVSPDEIDSRLSPKYMLRSKFSDYGEIDKTGIYDIHDIHDTAVLTFDDGSVASANWRTLEEDDIAIRIFSKDGTLLLKEDLGLCPCSAYGDMFDAIMRASDNQLDEWEELDLCVHHLVHTKEMW